MKTRHSNKYYLKSNKKDSKISLTADYKIRVYISIKIFLYIFFSLFSVCSLRL